MRKVFPLFQSHLDKAKSYWEKIVRKGDLAVDATCGNGRDTLFLAGLGAKVTSIDIQREAIEEAKALLEREGVGGVEFYLGCHSTFPSTLSIGSLKLIIYNLGYLPGGDKSIVTRSETTIASLESAVQLIAAGGLLSVTCYPGHEEGAAEEKRVLEFCSTLDPKLFSCTHERWLNRREAPSLLLIQKGE